MEVYGLLGEKLSHSMSPAIYKILFEKYKLKGTYSLYEINKNNFENAVNSVKTLGIKGVNVTIPYKEDVLKQLDEIDLSVNKIEACNCVKITDGKAKGYNTDYYGVLAALNFHNVEISGKDCVVLGSGGASKSVVALLKDLNAKSIKVVQRQKKGTDEGIVTYIDYSELVYQRELFLVVNTTPIGMYPNVSESPITKEVLKNFEVCFDAVYNPIETKLLKEAKELGVLTIDGLYMLVGQAINAFEIFSEIEVAKNDFLTIYEEVLALLTEKI